MNEQVKYENDSLYIIELEERLEFGAALIDSDLDADDNSGCTNGGSCSTPNAGTCVNGTC